MFQVASLGAIDPTLQVGALILGLAIAIILHEVAHGYVALRLGDPTAYYAGRLTLNPIKHVDLWGTILIPLFLIISVRGSCLAGRSQCRLTTTTYEMESMVRSWLLWPAP